jgi:unsaturated rhamnogalacturonyl hydrolase
MHTDWRTDLDKIAEYIDYLLEGSTPDAPLWNIEKIKQGKKVTWNYVDGCMIGAVLEMYDITGKEKYLRFADAFTDHRVMEDGTIDGYSVDELNIDNINAGKTLFKLWDKTGKEKYRKAIDLIYSQIGHMPRTAEGSFWHKKIYPDQVWLDGLYMCQPFYTEYETRFNGCKNYDDIYRQFELVRQNMLDTRSGLYYHAYDCSRRAFWCDKVTGLSNNFWLRAIGWFSMAMLDTLNAADPAYGGGARYDALKDQYIALMKAMHEYQDASGMWYQVVNVGGMKGNYLETSGSAIMAYSYLRGARLGFLPAEYAEYGKEAFNGICSKYMTSDGNGIHLGGICLVAGLGGERMRSGTYEYYMSEPVVKDDAKGVGPFLLAYSEMLRLGM